MVMGLPLRLRHRLKKLLAGQDPKPVTQSTAVSPGKNQNHEQYQREFSTKLMEALNSATLPARTNCPACAKDVALRSAGVKTAHCLFTSQLLQRHECPHCGLIFGPLPLIQMAPVELGTLYDLIYKIYSEGDTRFSQEKTFYALNPSRVKTYLNYACGDWAGGIQRLLDVGWTVDGYEPFMQVPSHPQIFSHAKELQGRRYDGVFSNNYLEHIQNLEGFFSEMRELLVDGGAMAHSTPCFEYRYEVSPFHLYFFTGESMEIIARRAGFVVEQTIKQDADQPGMDYFCKVFRKQ